MSFIRETVSKMMAWRETCYHTRHFLFQNTEKEKVSSPETCIHFQLLRPPKYMFVGMQRRIHHNPWFCLHILRTGKEREMTLLWTQGMCLFFETSKWNIILTLKGQLIYHIILCSQRGKKKSMNLIISLSRGNSISKINFRSFGVIAH